MTLELATRQREDETLYHLVLNEEQVAALSSGYVPRLVKAMAIDVLAWADQDEARARRPERKPRKKGKAA
jgi:hypothetical protein